MATKRFHWFKLTDTFLDSGTVDHIMSQKNGAQTMMLYFTLCMMSVNSGGMLVMRVGNQELPHDAESIRRNTKWFSAQQISDGIRLLESLGLIEKSEQGAYRVTGFAELVGGETDAAARMRRTRTSNTWRTNGEQCSPDVTPDVRTNGEQTANNVATEIRDKSKEIRDKSVENNTTWGNPISQEPSTVVEPTGEERPDFNTLEAYASGNIRNMTPYNCEEMLSFRDDLPDDLIRHAIDEACATARSTPTWSYTRAILNRYVDSGFKTVGDAKAAEQAHREGRNRHADRGRTAGGDDGPRRVFDGETIL